MQHTWSFVGLFSVALAFTPACSNSHGGGGDDDPIIDTGGEGEGEGEGEGGGEPTCEAACANVVEICDGATLTVCEENCGRFEDASEGACLVAFGDYNSCISTASACDPADGVAGCDTEGQALDAPCANGCVDVVDCVNACPAGDQPCGEGCFTNGDPDGVSKLNALIECWTTECGQPPAAEADMPAWEECLDGACLDEQSACR